MDRLLIVFIGGLVPAFAFGIAAIFQKAAIGAGLGPAGYMVCDGLVMLAAGLLLQPVFGETTWPLSAIPLALIGGLLFALASGAISFALRAWHAPISLLAPITVISTLVTVVASFIVFREDQEVAAGRLLLGALLIVAGAALVATS